MILNPQDLALLTGKRQRYAQRRVLLALGIPYRLRPDGTRQNSRLPSRINGLHDALTKKKRPIVGPFLL